MKYFHYIFLRLFRIKKILLQQFAILFLFTCAVWASPVATKQINLITNKQNHITALAQVIPLTREYNKRAIYTTTMRSTICYKYLPYNTYMLGWCLFALETKNILFTLTLIFLYFLTHVHTHTRYIIVLFHKMLFHSSFTPLVLFTFV